MMRAFFKAASDGRNFFPTFSLFVEKKSFALKKPTYFVRLNFDTSAEKVSS